MADVQESSFRAMAAWGLLAACLLFFLGFAWDIQWHADVGPDTFFTAPHTLLYSGAALGGLICLYAVAVTTLRFWRRVPGVTAETTTPWLGLFQAPLGFIVGGLGAVAFILSGLYDLWWHTIFGFDVTLLSPPHIGLFMSGIISNIGAMYAFASEYNRQKRQVDSRAPWATVMGFTLALALLLAQFNFFLAIGLSSAFTVGPFILYAVLSAIIVTPGLVVSASFLQRPGVGILTGLCFTLIRLVVWHFAPWATAAYAAALGLPFKGIPLGVPAMGVAMSPWLLVAGAVLDIMLLLIRRAGPGAPLKFAVGAAAAAIAHHLADPRWVRYVEVANFPLELKADLLTQFAAAAVPTLLVVPVLAAVCGAFAWRLGVVFRYTDR